MAERNEIDDEGQDDLAWVEELLSIENNENGECYNRFEFPCEVCTMCEGYYGPCFDQYVCTTCHAFLFPDDINLPAETNFSEVG